MFIVARHGNTFEADEMPRRVGARTDLPLTQCGIEQAAALGAFLAGEGYRFTQVLVSPLLRTRQTAEAILASQVNPPKPQMADFLREIDYGPDENRAESKVIGRIGSGALAAWEANATAPPGWIVEPASRVAAWRNLFATNSGKDETVLLVTSNGAARFALMADPALTAAAAGLPSLKLPTGGFGVIRQKQDGALGLGSWGERP